MSKIEIILISICTCIIYSVSCATVYDLEEYRITTDFDVMKTECDILSLNLSKQLHDIASLNVDIEESKKKLLEIQFNVTVASMFYDFR